MRVTASHKICLTRSVEKSHFKIVIPASEPESMRWIPGQTRDDSAENLKRGDDFYGACLTISLFHGTSPRSMPRAELWNIRTWYATYFRTGRESGS